METRIVQLTYLQHLYCLEGVCKVDGEEFSGYKDVSMLLGESVLEGNIACINHTMESAIDLSVKLFMSNKQLQETIEELNKTIVELVEKDYQLLTGEVI